MDQEVSYEMRIAVRLPYQQAIEQTKAALKEQGFGILTTIDIKETMREKLGKEFRPYVILGACNPKLSHEALTEELEVGLLLPCNVVIYEEEQGSIVSIADPEKVVGIAQNAKLNEFTKQAKEKLQAALYQIESQTK